MYSGIGLLVFLVVYEALSSGAQVCPKDFQCGNFGNLSFPFTDSAHPNCGLCMANCSSDQTSLNISLSHQTDERWYELLKSPLQGNSIRVLDTNLQDYLNQQMCSSFIDAIRQVNSTAISFTVEPNITMIRCTTDTNTIDKSGMETLKSLDNFTLCRDFTIYYRNPKDGDKPLNNIGPLPQQCQCITLPMAPEDSITKKSGLFGLLTAEFDLSWHLSDNCVHCLNGKGSQCDGDNSPCANAGKHVSKGMSEIAKKIIIVVRAISELFVVLPTLSLCVLITRLLCVLITRRRRQKASTEEDEELKKLNEIRDTQTRQYDFSLIKTATRDFSTTNKLGRGGFGEVYKGVLFDGKEIAVKRLSTTSGQGENEFMNEVKSLAKLQHKCLVKLLGFCLEKTERLVIYEFMANGSLDKVLFDPVNRSRLDWERRYKIMKSIARGILYLHEDSHMMIIHRDLKASNILLDEEMNAKISDFGMARLFVLDEGEVLTKRIAGTL